MCSMFTADDGIRHGMINWNGADRLIDYTKFAASSMRSHLLTAAAEGPARARGGGSEIWIDAPTAAAAEARHRGGSNAANAVSFGFVTIAILVSMFLVVAIVEKILRPRRQISGTAPGAAGIVDSHDIDFEFAQMSQRPLQWGTSIKPSRDTSSSKGISVLMPGHEVPTFIAHPAPIQAAAATRPQ